MVGSNIVSGHILLYKKVSVVKIFTIKFGYISKIYYLCKYVCPMV